MTHQSDTPGEGLDPNELWEIFFGILKGNVPDELTDAVLAEAAEAIAALSRPPEAVATQPPADMPPDWMDGFTACALLMSGQYDRYAALRDEYLAARPKAGSDDNG